MCLRCTSLWRSCDWKGDECIDACVLSIAVAGMGVLVSYIFNCGSSALLVLSRRVLGVCCIPWVNVKVAELGVRLIDAGGGNC